MSGKTRPAPTKQGGPAMYEAPRKQGLYDPSHEHDACGMGFVVDAHGRKSHAIVSQAVQVLENLEHRGACGCEKNTGDGAGILIQMPHRFLAEECERAGFRLPGPGRYGAGIVFLPRGAADRKRCEEIWAGLAAEEGMPVLGWRDLPTDNSAIGPTARAAEPVMRQVFVARHEAAEDDDAFERKLYVLRRRVENAVLASPITEKSMFYVPSFSHRTLVYKGMLIAPQLPGYFPDIVDSRVESCLAMVHSRFSTNTFPNWARAHPYRYVCHNGEINTLRGNVNWMHAREALFSSPLFGDDLKKILPVIDQGGSDSAMFDNVLEMLALSGRSLPHAVMMMIPEPWSGHESMSEKKKAFYEYHSCLMEPWDGPASIAFTDGIRIGATLDRNGLRPSRYYVTKDGLVVLASEVGVLDIPAERILTKGRLQPGRMFLVDTEEGRIVADEEIKLRTANEKPYGMWLRDNLVTLQEVPEAPSPHEPDHETVLKRQLAFGYSREDVEQLVLPMGREGVEPVGSMGDDTPLAVLSERPQLLYNYFKQLFAQVTNPPIDCIREELIMATDTTVGPEQNLLDPTPLSAHQIKLGTPILTNEELEKLRYLSTPKGRSGAWAFKATTIPILFPPEAGGAGLEKAMEDVCRRASAAVAGGHEHHRPVGPRGRPGERAHPRAPRGGGRPPPPDPRGDAHPRRSRARERRAARGAPLRPAHRLRRRSGQSLPRLRDPARSRASGPSARRRRRARGQELHQGPEQGSGEGDLQDGDLHHPELLRRADLRGHRPRPGRRRQVLHLDAVAHLGHRYRSGGAGGHLPALGGLRHQRDHHPRARSRGQVQVAPRRRAPPVQPPDHPQAPARVPHQRLPPLPGVQHPRQPAGETTRHPARAHGAEAAAAAGAARRGGVGRRDRAPVQDGGDVLRLDQQGGARGAGRGHEPDRRQEQHRRGRRRPRALLPRAERRLEEQRDQAGGLGPLRGDEQLPRQRPRAPDQDGAGGQARRGRAAPGSQGLPVDREGAPLDARASGSSRRRPTTTSTRSKTWPS